MMYMILGLIYLLFLFFNMGTILAYIQAQKGILGRDKKWHLTNSDILIYTTLASMPGFFGTYSIVKTCEFLKYGWQVPFTTMENYTVTEDQPLPASMGTCKSIWKE